MITILWIARALVLADRNLEQMRSREEVRPLTRRVPADAIRALPDRGCRTAAPRGAR